MSEMSAAPDGIDPLGRDTVPKFLVYNARHRRDRPAMREKDLGIWQSWTWGEVAVKVADLAGGLAALGFRRGDKLALIGDNRPELYWAMAAVQALGGIPVPVYQDSVADEIQYVIEHAEARFALAENQEQVDKLLVVKDRLPALETILYSDPRGMRHYTQPFLRPLAVVMEQGQAHNAAHPGFFEAEIAKGKGSDISLICYTSGTTGRPKGVMLSHDNVVRSANLAIGFDTITDRDEILAYLPLAWVGDNFISYAEATIAGFCVNCPESADTVLQDLREIGPTYFFAPPRIFENLLTTVMIRMEDAGRIKRGMFHYFIGVAHRVGRKILEGKPVPVMDRLRYGLGELLVYGPLKNVLGMTRLRLAYTAGEAIGPDIFDFFRALGINLKQLYGQTECTVYLCLQTDADVRSDTVGPPGPGIEVKIDEASGEVLYRSPGVFVGYYKNEAATAETKTADGWVHTGDAGVFTDTGHLRIIDRAKDVGRLTNGALFAPKYVENKLKFFSYIREAVAFGDGRDSVAAFINIDLAAVGSWAERNGISYTSYSDLAARTEVYDLIRGCIEQVNRDLASDSSMAASQVRRFLILHKELDADDGELTRTRKVRRRTIAERYGALIEALYSDREAIAVDAKITFEDGRTGSFKANLKIASVETYSPMRKAG
ncbi:AMP-binding protein [Ferrovibrio xuzhouensis]|uniref:AMP-binding protein n=1 Tax=Ferrovibrio xuzhouensis TaxID=1576914 RepID=A0ABV7VGH0_9PROT